VNRSHLFLILFLLIPFGLVFQEGFLFAQAKAFYSIEGVKFRIGQTATTHSLLGHRVEMTDERLSTAEATPRLPLLPIFTELLFDSNTYGHLFIDAEPYLQVNDLAPSREAGHKQDALTPFLNKNELKGCSSSTEFSCKISVDLKTASLRFGYVYGKFLRLDEKNRFAKGRIALGMAYLDYQSQLNLCNDYIFEEGGKVGRCQGKTKIDEYSYTGGTLVVGIGLAFYEYRSSEWVVSIIDAELSIIQLPIRFKKHLAMSYVEFSNSLDLISATWLF